MAMVTLVVESHVAQAIQGVLKLADSTKKVEKGVRAIGAAGSDAERQLSAALSKADAKMQRSGRDFANRRWDGGFYRPRGGDLGAMDRPPVGPAGGIGGIGGRDLMGYAAGIGAGARLLTYYRGHGGPQRLPDRRALNADFSGVRHRAQFDRQSATPRRRRNQ